MALEVLKARWAEVAEKLVTLAEAVPEGSYGWRPTPEARTFADQLRHVAFWNEYAAKTLRGEQADGRANELPPGAYPTKAKLVEALQQSFDGVAQQLAKSKASPAASVLDTVVSFVQHAGEHYGQMAVYARSNGVVPPASR